MNRKIAKLSDVKMLLAEIREEIQYHGNENVLFAFYRVVEGWGVSAQEIKEYV